MGLYWAMDLGPTATDLMMKGETPAPPPVDAPLIEKVDLEVDGSVTCSAELKLRFQIPDLGPLATLAKGRSSSLLSAPYLARREDDVRVAQYLLAAPTQERRPLVVA